MWNKCFTDDHDVMSMNTYSLKDANEKDTNVCFFYLSKVFDVL